MIRFQIIVGLFIIAMSILLLNSCNQLKTDNQEIRPITESEIIAFQKGYGISFNAISKAIADNTYYETIAKRHIKEHYNFEEEQVIVNIGNDTEEPLRNTAEALLSYLIGKNNSFPKDEGITRGDWRKIEWQNHGIIKDLNTALAIGQTIMTDSKGTQLVQNFVMCLKKNKEGKIKLIAHNITHSCDQ